MKENKSKIIFNYLRQKITAGLLIFAGVTTFIYIVLNFGYNHKFVGYEADFNYLWALPLQVNPYNLTSLKSVEEVKSRSSDFVDIDSKAISQNLVLQVENSNYKLSLAGDYFESDERARRFFAALGNVFMEEGLSVPLATTSYMENYEQAWRLTDKLMSLENEINEIFRGYDNLLMAVGNVELEYGTLARRRAEFQLFLADNSLTALWDELIAGNYLTEREYEEKKANRGAYEQKKSELEKRRKQILEIMKDLNSTFSSGSLESYFQELQWIDIRLLEVEKELNTINSPYDTQINEGYIQKVEDYAELLGQQALIYEAGYKEVLTTRSYFNFLRFQVTGKLDKGACVIISLAIGALSGFFGAIILGYLEDVKKKI